jgi:hypothetical protein
MLIAIMLGWFLGCLVVNVVALACGRDHITRCRGCQRYMVERHR